MKGVVEYTLAAERSISPVIMSMASPMAMRPYSAVLASSTGTSEVRNPGFRNWKTTAMTSATTAMLNSGNRSSAPSTPGAGPAAGLGPGGASTAIFWSLVTTLSPPSVCNRTGAVVGMGPGHQPDPCPARKSYRALCRCVGPGSYNWYFVVEEPW